MGLALRLVDPPVLLLALDTAVGRELAYLAVLACLRSAVGVVADVYIV